MHKLRILTILSLIFMLLLAACGGTAADNTAADNTAADNAVADNAAADSDTADVAQEGYRLAAIYPGSITDADYNYLGHLGVSTAQNEYGLEVTYSKQVGVPDAESIIREYIANGYNVIFTHGGQFMGITTALANEFPNVNFIGEADAPVADLPANLWVMVRNMEIGAYGAGAVSAMVTETGTVGYISGITLPFTYAEVHAIEQAYADMGADVEVIPVWTGDFNDPAQAKLMTNALIVAGADVIISSLNFGVTGVFEAAAESDFDIKIIVKYTDKSDAGPDHYITSMLYDFAGPLTGIIGSIIDGETSGNYELGFDTGLGLQFPLMNVDSEINTRAEEIIASMVAGEITVEKNTTVIEK